MHSRHLKLLIAILVFSQPVFAGKIYKVVDGKTGEVTFTDEPPADAGAVEIHGADLPPINSQTTPEVEPKPQPQPEITPAAVNYQDFRVIQPSDQATIPPGQEDLEVQLSIEPALQEGHLVQLFFDGKKFGQPASATSFRVADLYRGSHTISATIVDQTGKTLKSTPATTIFVHRGKVTPKPAPKPAK